MSEIEESCSPLELVRRTTCWVMSQASHVTIDDEAVDAAAKRLLPVVEKRSVWDSEGWHHNDGGPSTVQYLLVVDAINFCFWPDEDLEYEPLVKGLKHALEEDIHALDTDRLCKCTALELRQLIGWPRPLPLEEERAALLRELGQVLAAKFKGHAIHLVTMAGGSASKLVGLLSSHFPGFQDSCKYRERDIFLYKRAQIFVADLWGAFQGSGYGYFHDIQDLTMFADYLVPAVLRDWGVLKYSDSLAALIDSQTTILHGSEEEVELRSASIVAVDYIREKLADLGAQKVTSVQIDWWLWNHGVDPATKLGQVHRTVTTFY